VYAVFEAARLDDAGDSRVMDVQTFGEQMVLDLEAQATQVPGYELDYRTGSRSDIT